MRLFSIKFVIYSEFSFFCQLCFAIDALSFFSRFLWTKFVLFPLSQISMFKEGHLLFMANVQESASVNVFST